MDPEVAVALVAAGASLVVAAVGTVSAALAQRTSRRSSEELEQVKAQLAERSAERNAWREYEFEARKRLYAECAPLIFQLSELGERALGRILGLARTAAAGDLDDERSWLKRDYYRESTYYRLIAPLSLGRLLRRRLTQLDLSIDPYVRWQYTVVRVLMDSFTDDFDLAGLSADVELDHDDRLTYLPHAPDAGERRLDDPAIYWQQGVPRGILDDAINALLVKGDDGSERVIEFHEYQALRRARGDDADVCRAFDRVAYLFDQFHPRTRPVLWRILVAQACLYRTLARAHRTEDHDESSVGVVLGIERAKLEWRPSESIDHTRQVDDALRVGLTYAEQRTRHYWVGTEAGAE